MNIIRIKMNIKFESKEDTNQMAEAVEILRYFLHYTVTKEIQSYMGVYKYNVFRNKDHTYSEVHSINWLNFNKQYSRRGYPARHITEYIDYDYGPPLVFNGIIDEWWLNGVLTRADGPSVITFGQNGKIISEEWYENNKKHRIKHPAVIQYWDSTQNVQYWQEGKQIFPDND